MIGVFFSFLGAIGATVVLIYYRVGGRGKTLILKEDVDC
jgi:hypothetical protein